MTTAIESIISGISQMIGETWDLIGEIWDLIGEIWDLYPCPLILGIVVGITMFVSFLYYFEFDRAIPIKLTLILAIVVSLSIFTAEEMRIYILIILNTFAFCLLFSVLFYLFCGFIRYCVIIFDIRKYLKKQVKK